MKTTAYYFERMNQKTLLVETEEDQDLALKTLSKFTGIDYHYLLFRIGKGKVIQNTTVKDTYFKKFMDVEKLPLSDFEILSTCETCKVCGK